VLAFFLVQSQDIKFIHEDGIDGFVVHTTSLTVGHLPSNPSHQIANLPFASLNLPATKL
jgi:hypothetical protein